jgi:fructose 5-dehydrogenase large subunit
MVSTTGAEVVIAGTGIVGCLIAEQMLDAGLSVLMLEAGPRIDRGRIIENYRNMPPAEKIANPDGPFPPKPWALHPMDYTGDPDKDYLITSGPDAKAYQQTYVRYVGGATWHWAGTLWRLTPEDMIIPCWNRTTRAPSMRSAQPVRLTQRCNGRRSGRSPT